MRSIFICPFRKYKHALGVPGQGIHRHRFMGMAVMDYIMTIIAAFVTTLLFGIPLELSTALWFVGGIILHILFCVPTQTTKYLGLL